MKNLKRNLAIAVASLAAFTHAARAQFPDKPVTLVVPFAAGGPSDQIARDLAEAFQAEMERWTRVIKDSGETAEYACALHML